MQDLKVGTVQGGDPREHFPEYTATGVKWREAPWKSHRRLVYIWAPVLHPSPELSKFLTLVSCRVRPERCARNRAPS